MSKVTRLGELERAVMDYLWSAPEPQTVRQMHKALPAQRELAYTDHDGAAAAREEPTSSGDAQGAVQP